MSSINGEWINDGGVTPAKRGEVVYNDAGVDLTEGMLVSFKAWNETNKCRTVVKADADGGYPAQAVVRKKTIYSGKTGRVYLTYRLPNQNTNSAGAVGDPVYLSTTAAGWTLTNPTAASSQVVGRVAVKSATVGVVELNVSEAPVTSYRMGDIWYFTGSITNAQMLAIETTPITLVPAQGAGVVTEFLSGALFFDYTAAYTEPSAPDDMVVRYKDGTGTIVSQDIDSTNFLTATADAACFVAPLAGAITTVRLKTACDNQPLVLHNTGGAFGGGNAANVVRWKVAVRIHAAGW